MRPVHWHERAPRCIRTTAQHAATARIRVWWRAHGRGRQAGPPRSAEIRRDRLPANRLRDSGSNHYQEKLFYLPARSPSRCCWCGTGGPGARRYRADSTDSASAASGSLLAVVVSRG